MSAESLTAAIAAQFGNRAGGAGLSPGQVLQINRLSTL